VLIERYKLTPDQAFQVLSRASMNTNSTLRDIADHLVHTGELLSAEPRTDSGSPTARSDHGPKGPDHP
jgi:hypothetical protein